MNEFDNENFDKEEEKMARKILGERYYLLKVDNAVRFTDLIKNENIDYADKEVTGFEYSELELLFDKFIEYGVSGVFMQFKLMNDLTSGKGLDNLYEFKPLKGNKKVGILIPHLVTRDDKPNREEVINETDVGLLDQMTDKFNNGEIDFNAFLSSL